MDFLIYLIHSSLVALAYLPGASLLYLINRRLRLNISSLTTFLGGAVLWSYILVFLASAFEILNLDIRMLFYYFTLVSIVTLLISFPALFLNMRPKDSKNNLRQVLPSIEFFGVGSLKAYVVVIFTIISSITLYSYILNNWDAVFVYLPIAKGITYSGKLLDNPLFPANPASSQEWPPAQLIIYAWAMQTTMGCIRFLPLVYLLIALLATYGIAKELLRNKNAPLVAAAFLITFPAVQVLTAHKGFYLDLSMIAYAFSAFFFLLRGLREGGHLNFLLCGASLSMAALSKEPAVLLIPLVLGILLTQVIRRKLLNVFVTTAFIASPFVAHYVLSVQQAVFEFTLTHGIITVAIIIAVALVAWCVYNPEDGLNKRYILTFILSSIPAAITYAFLFSRALLKWVFPNYGISPESQAVLAAFLSATYGDVRSIYADMYLKSVQVFRMFAHGLTAGILILPIIVGVLSCIYKVRKGDKSYGIVLYWLIFLVGMWMYFFNANISSWEFRRLTYMTPLLAIITTEGFYSLASYLKSDDRLVPLMALITSSTIVIYFWIAKAKLDWLNVGAPVYGGHIMSPVDAVVYSVPIVVSAIVFKKVGRNFGMAGRAGRMRTIALLSGIVLISLGLFFSSFIPQLKTYDPSYYDSLGSQPDHSIWASDVEEYFRANSINGAVLGSSISAFSYTTGIKTVDIGDLVINRLDILKESNASNLKEKLIEMNIRYILAPNEKAPLSTYPTWKAALQLFPSLSDLLEDGHSKVIMKFKAYTLYALV